MDMNKVGVPELSRVLLGCENAAAVLLSLPTGGRLSSRSP